MNGKLAAFGIFLLLVAGAGYLILNQMKSELVPNALDDCESFGSCMESAADAIQTARLINNLEPLPPILAVLGLVLIGAGALSSNPGTSTHDK